MTATEAAAELILRPARLPRVAARLSEARATELAIAGCGAVAGALCAPGVAQRVPADGVVQHLLRYAAGGFWCAVMAGAMAAFVVRSGRCRARRSAPTWRARQAPRFVPAPDVSGDLVRNLLDLLASPATLLALLGAAVMLAAWARRQLERDGGGDACLRCHYSLLGLPEPCCPECGLPFDPAKLARLPRA